MSISTNVNLWTGRPRICWRNWFDRKYAVINTVCQLTHWCLTPEKLENLTWLIIKHNNATSLHSFLGETSESEADKVGDHFHLMHPKKKKKKATSAKMFFFPLSFQVIFFYFHTVPSRGRKDGRARWHLKSAFPSPLRQSVPFPYRQQTPPPPMHRAAAHAYKSPTYLLSAHWQWYPWLPPPSPPHLESRLRPLDP